MTNYGKIKSYDSGNGVGSIAPEKGGDALPFRKSDLQQEAQEPKQDQRYGYDVKDAGNGKSYAINLQQQQGEAESQNEHDGNQQG